MDSAASTPVAAMVLSPQQMLGRFRILALAGQGGMGDVYRAEDTSLGRVVALKTIRSDDQFYPPEENTGSDGSADRARFEREARVMAALSHPNIVTIYSFETIDGIHVLCMEWIEGQSLRQIKNQRIGELPQRMTWLRDIASGLAALHRVGIVHRDLKPDNVMIAADDGRVRLLDFGIARITPQSAVVDSPEGAALTQTHDVFGTPRYMAPEQRMGARVDGRADQFAWGIVAYELLAGDHPQNLLPETNATSPQDFPRAAPPPLTAFDPRIPHELASVVLRSLAMLPDARYASMDMLVGDLDNVLRQQPSSSPALDPQHPTMTSRPLRPLPAPPAGGSTNTNTIIFVVCGFAVVIVGLLVIGVVYLLQMKAHFDEKELGGLGDKPSAGPGPPIVHSGSGAVMTDAGGALSSPTPTSMPTPTSTASAKPSSRASFRSIALDSAPPAEMEAAAFNAYFASRQPALLKCFAKDPPPRDCHAGASTASCTAQADGLVSDCAVTIDGGSTNGHAQCWSSLYAQSCVASVFNGSHAPPLSHQSAEKKGQYTTMSISFHPVE